MKSFVFFSVGYALILLRLPQSFDSIYIQIIPIAYVFFFIFKDFVFNPQKALHSPARNNFLLILMFLLVVIGSFRSNKPNSSIIEIIARNVLMIVLILHLRILLRDYFESKKKTISTETAFLVINSLPFVLLAVVNLGLWLIGFENFSKIANENPGNAVLLGYFGIEITRVQFPLSNGINNYSSVLSTILTFALISLFILRTNKKLSLVSIALILPTLLLVDSRTAIIFPIVILFIVYITLGKNRINILKFTPIITVLSPIIFVGSILLLGQSSILDVISRGDSDIKTGNLRFIIWGIALSKLSVFNMIHLIGYGEFGQFASGASKEWSGVLNMFENSELTSSHNTLLTLIFDYGYLGVIIYILLIRKVCQILKQNWHIHKETVILIFSFLLCSIFMGTTESFFGVYNSNSMYLFFTTLYFAFCLKSENKFHIKTRMINMKPLEFQDKI